MYDRLLDLLSEVVTAKSLGQKPNTIPMVKGGQDSGQFYQAPRGNPKFPKPKKPVQGPSVTAGALHRADNLRRKR